MNNMRGWYHEHISERKINYGYGVARRNMALEDKNNKISKTNF